LADKEYLLRKQKAACGFSFPSWTSAGRAVAVFN